jgi:penicillin-binding protein 1A
MMKKCYEDKDLQISKDAFQRPDNLSIRVDCYEPRKAESTDSTAVPTDEEEQDPDQLTL